MAMGLFEHEARQFKFDVLREVAVRAYENTCTPNIEDELAYKLIPTTKQTSGAAFTKKEKSFVKEPVSPLVNHQT
jgi:ferredoxin hydrogenase large subunit